MSHSLAWRRFPPSGSKIDATSECGTWEQIGNPSNTVREALRAIAFACEASSDIEMFGVTIMPKEWTLISKTSKRISSNS